jgi:hypothetical protein
MDSFCAVLLLPKYRLLKNCTTDERAACHKYVREQLKILRDVHVTEAHDYLGEPRQKKTKTADTLFERFEDDNVHDVIHDKDDSHEYDSDEYEYEYDVNHSDELDIYLVMQIDKSSLTNNPLDFWKSNSEKLPLLSKLAKRIYSIPATSTNVERQFSSAGLIINQRRTNINPDQVDNILLLRSFKKLMNK